MENQKPSLSVKKYNREQPFLASIKDRYRLSRPGSVKESFHIVLDISGSDIVYRPGDTIAVLPENAPHSINRTLKVLGCSGDTLVPFGRDKKMYALKDLLRYNANISDVNKSLLQELASFTKAGEQIKHLLEPENKSEMRSYLEEHQVWDFLEKHLDPNHKLSADTLCKHLRPLIPRFYSISSSAMLYPNEVHFTITVPIYETNGIKRQGVAAGYLCEHAPLNKSLIPIYLQPTKDFLLPKSGDTSIIMIGPGTGVAPFRGFIQERFARGDTGENWLFFGECHRQFNYFYEDEWSKYCDSNFLRLDLAFSRDQEKKVYVQHKLEENASEIWSWVQDGAVIYVCGDAKHMAKDVDKVLHDIAQSEGHMSEKEAKAFIKDLRKQGRYLKDVY
ncbi:hypothetical protein SCG7109_AD_00030 [Chlamydiales bacterium SCGC AG-110-M15]|nr:hypothetical protein SCG7109_AD_00030 [Chlamydiales bacterium SCGC AG-110-M15]